MNHNSVATLNHLLQITNDRIAGFSKVEAKVWKQVPDLQQDFSNMVTQAHKMKSELETLIAEQNGIPEDAASFAGDLHRIWIDVKNSLSGDNAGMTLVNVRSGEQAAIDAYEKALDSGNLSPTVSHIVLDQVHALKASFSKFEKLGDPGDRA